MQYLIIILTLVLSALPVLEVGSFQPSYSPLYLAAFVAVSLGLLFVIYYLGKE